MRIESERWQVPSRDILIHKCTNVTAGSEHAAQWNIDNTEEVRPYLIVIMDVCKIGAWTLYLSITLQSRNVPNLILCSEVLKRSVYALHSSNTLMGMSSWYSSLSSGNYWGRTPYHNTEQDGYSTDTNMLNTLLFTFVSNTYCRASPALRISCWQPCPWWRPMPCWWGTSTRWSSHQVVRRRGRQLARCGTEILDP